MSAAAHDEITLPNGAIVGASLLVLFALVVALTAKLTDLGATRLDLTAPVEALTLRFLDAEGGNVKVIDHASGREIETISPGQNGFVRVVMRSFAYERAQRAIGPEMPFRLMRLEDGRTVIEDTATGRVVTLRAFGWSNAAAFAELLEKGRMQK